MCRNGNEIDLHPDADAAEAAADIIVEVESDEEPPALTDSDDSDDLTGCSNQPNDDVRDDVLGRKVIADNE